MNILFNTCSGTPFSKPTKIKDNLIQTKTINQIQRKQFDNHRKLLKQIYIDSALRKADKLDKEHETQEIEIPAEKISWAEFHKKSKM